MTKKRPTGTTILRKREAQAFVGGLGDTAFDALVKAGDLPPPISISDSSRTVGWVLSELEAWLAGRIAKRDAKSQ